MFSMLNFVISRLCIPWSLIQIWKIWISVKRVPDFGSICLAISFELQNESRESRPIECSLFAVTIIRIAFPYSQSIAPVFWHFLFIINILSNGWPASRTAIQAVDTLVLMKPLKLRSMVPGSTTSPYLRGVHSTQCFDYIRNLSRETVASWVPNSRP